MIKETVGISETNALSELTEEMTEIGQITEEEVEITDDVSQAEPSGEQSISGMLRAALT